MLEPSELIEIQRRVRTIFVHDKIRDYIVALVAATREHPHLALGASPRASLALLRCAQARAGMQELRFVLPDHVKAVFAQALAHRVILTPEARLSGHSAQTILAAIATSVPAPVGPAQPA